MLLLAVMLWGRIEPSRRGSAAAAPGYNRSAAEPSRRGSVVLPLAATRGGVLLPRLGRADSAHNRRRSPSRRGSAVLPIAAMGAELFRRGSAVLPLSP